MNAREGGGAARSPAAATEATPPASRSPRRLTVAIVADARDPGSHRLPSRAAPDARAPPDGSDGSEGSDAAARRARRPSLAPRERQSSSSHRAERATRLPARPLAIDHSDARDEDDVDRTDASAPKHRARRDAIDAHAGADAEAIVHPSAPRLCAGRGAVPSNRKSDNWPGGLMMGRSSA